MRTSIYMDLYIYIGTVEVKLQALVYDILLPRVPEGEDWSVDG